jgi:plasmid segregation protein ParM
MNEDIILIGNDPGFKSMKIARVQGNDILTYVLPSAVGLADRSVKDGLTLGGVVRPHRATRHPFRVAFEGIEYLVGPNVGHFTKPIDQMDFERFQESPGLRAAFYTALYQMVNGGGRQVALAIALPVEVLQKKEEALRVEQAMQSWLIGNHVFNVDGVETVLTITKIRAKIPQPVATWFDWGMDTTGKWVKGKEAQRAPTLIIDQGFNTLDVVAVEDGQISDRLSGGDTLGMSWAADRLIEVIRHRYDGLTLELYQANDLIEAVVKAQAAEIHVHGQLQNVTREARQALNALGVEVDNYLRRSLGKAKDAYQVLLTGGGVLAMGDRLLRRFPKATIMPDPVLANARGLAKLAIRPGFLV